MGVWLPLKGILLMLLSTWRADYAQAHVFNSPYARTSLGHFKGTQVKVHRAFPSVYNYSKVNQFLGIPYAKKPVDSLRFKKPEPAESFDYIYKADTKRADCIQHIGNQYYLREVSSHVEEDCLYLNIWTPEKRPRKLPVLFWIYEEGFISRMRSWKSKYIPDPIYDGRVLAADGEVVVVTVNYRTGLFGFLTSGTEEAPGNYGMYDILEALKWVNKHIEAFGGDPNQVTLGGQGAGSIAVGLLCVSPLTEGLFHRVVMESGSPAYTLADNSTSDNVALSQRLAKAVGCASDEVTISTDPKGVVSCLRGKDALDLAKTLHTLHPTSMQSFFPTYGDEILPRNARQELIAGNFHDVQVLIGNNADEGSFLLTSAHPEVFGFYGEKDARVNKTYGKSLLSGTFSSFPDPEAVIEHYLGSVDDDDYDRIRYQVYTAMGDYSLLCPTVFFAESYSQAGNNVYYYYFTHHPKTMAHTWASWMGSKHFEEVPFVFGLPVRSSLFNALENLLSKKMVAIWTNFIKTGSTGVSEWPSYSRISPVYMKLGSTRYNYTSRFKKYALGPHKDNCDFFRSYFGFQ